MIRRKLIQVFTVFLSMSKFTISIFKNEKYHCYVGYKIYIKVRKKKYFLISNLVTALEKKCKQKQKNWVAT